MFETVRWLLICLLIAMIMKPLFPLRSLRPMDGGFSVSLGLGTGILFTVVWFVCAVTGLPFDSVSCIAVTFLFAIVFIKRKKSGPEDADKIGARDERRRFLGGFCVFALLFIIAVWVKGYKPIIDFQTEQYMDYGFMNAMFRQKRVPFEDIWFAGSRVNYYYLGQAVAVFFCRLAFATPDYGYNLMLCMLFAFLALSVFSLTEAFLARIPFMNRFCPALGGVMASLLCTCGGNGHWIGYGIIRQLRDKITGMVPDKRYWFPDSTLFIGYDPDTLDKAKHEFPSYTLILGDLHAHVCNMLFTIPLLVLLFDYALDDSRDPKEEEGAEGIRRAEDFARKLYDRRLFIMGIILGLFKGVNYWDFPIYFVVAGAVILFCDLRKYGGSAKTVVTVLFKGLFIYLVGAVVMLPFTMNYDKPFSGIHLCDRHSPLIKLVIIWFVHVLTVLSLLIFVFLEKHAGKRRGERRGFELYELIIMAVSLCGLGLILMPELIYVKDIYGDEFQRYNTMFKLTFQGFILLSISSGMCIGIFLNAALRSKAVRIILRSAGIVYCMAAIALGAYMGWSVRAWFGNVSDPSLRKGISASAFIEEDPMYDNVREAIGILNEDPDRRLHIIEEGGNSYRPQNRLSVFTGAVTVAGWYVHEWVWHNDREAIEERHGEVKAFYTLGDEDYCRKIIDRYDIDYIYVGPETTGKYEVNAEGFKRLGEHIWESDDGRYMLIKTGQADEPFR